MDLGGRRGGEDLGRVVEGEPRSEYIILKNVFNKKKTFLKDEKSKNHVMSMVKSSKKMTLFFSNSKANFPCRLFEHLFHGLPLNAKPI